MADIDHFKKVNDTHGHSTGDRLLKQVAKTIAAQCRQADLPARYGGEEFCILLPRVRVEQAQTIAESLRSKVKDIDTDGIHVTLSIGICEINEQAQPDLEGALNKADIALYSAKKNGRDQVMVANDND